jgi:hypothetical protein
MLNIWALILIDFGIKIKKFPFWALSQNCEKRLLASSCPSVRMEQLGSHGKKYGRPGQATYNNIIRRMRVACWMTKATDAHSEYVILLISHGNNVYANVPQCYVTCTLLIFLHFYTLRLLIILKFVVTMCQYYLFNNSVTCAHYRLT